MICRHYHQTTIISDDDARTLEIKAISQENKILSFLQSRTTGTSAEDIQSSGILQRNTPITSVRRALTNLSRQGKVCRTGEETGQYGQPIGQYRAVL